MTSLVPITETPQPAKIRSLVVGTAMVEQYAQDVLGEARRRVQTWEGKRDDAADGIRAATEADEPHQKNLYRSRLTTANRRLQSALNYLNVVESGYLPMPSMPGVPLNRLHYRPSKQQQMIPPDALRALAEAKKVPGFTSFELVDGRNAFGQAWRTRARDPILVGVADRELFPIAWWR